LNIDFHKNHLETGSSVQPQQLKQHRIHKHRFAYKKSDKNYYF